MISTLLLLMLMVQKKEPAKTNASPTQLTASASDTFSCDPPSCVTDLPIPPIQSVCDSDGHCIPIEELVAKFVHEKAVNDALEKRVSDLEKRVDEQARSIQFLVWTTANVAPSAEGDGKNSFDMEVIPCKDRVVQNVDEGCVELPLLSPNLEFHNSYGICGSDGCSDGDITNYDIPSGEDNNESVTRPIIHADQAPVSYDVPGGEVSTWPDSLAPRVISEPVYQDLESCPYGYHFQIWRFIFDNSESCPTIAGGCGHYDYQDFFGGKVVTIDPNDPDNGHPDKCVKDKAKKGISNPEGDNPAFNWRMYAPSAPFTVNWAGRGCNPGYHWKDKSEQACEKDKPKSGK